MKQTALVVVVGLLAAFGSSHMHVTWAQEKPQLVPQTQTPRRMDIDECIQWLLKGSRIFGEHFYGVLFEQHPRMREFFDGADMKQQSVLLTMQLTVIGQCHSDKRPAVDAYLQVLGTKHKRRGIPLEAYHAFQEVLLETLERFLGPLWEESLAAQWRDALDVATEKMLEGYEQALGT